MILDEHGRVDAERTAEEADFRREWQRDALVDAQMACDDFAVALRAYLHTLTKNEVIDIAVRLSADADRLRADVDRALKVIR